jgi:hypothetical protein
MPLPDIANYLMLSVVNGVSYNSFIGELSPEEIPFWTQMNADFLD